MAVLALDTTSRNSFVSVAHEGKILSEACAAEQRGAEVLPSLISAALHDSGVEIGALTSVIVGIGPGSFTGIRTGIAAAAGLRAARGVEVIGISGLVAAAVLAGKQSRFMLPVLRANANESYCCVLERKAVAGAGAFRLSVKEQIQIVQTPELETDARWKNVSGSEIERIDLDRPDKAAGTPASLLARLLYDVDQGGSIFPDGSMQRGGQDRVLEPLYVKSVHAKTLRERGIERIIPFDSN